MTRQTDYKPEILVIDEEEKNLTSFRDIFGEHYDIYMADSVREVNEFFERYDIRVIVLDQRLSDTDNEEIFKRIETEDQDIAGVILTGYGDMEDVIEKIDGNRICYYLKKPWNDSEARFAVHNTLEVVDLRRHAVKSDKRFRSAIEYAPVGIVNVLPTGQIIRANRRFTNMVGYTEDELLSMTFEEIIHPEDVKVYSEQIERLERKEMETFTQKKRYIRKDGTFNPGSVTVSQILKADGDPDYFMNIVEDMSSRRKTEKALRESEELFRGLLESAADGIVIVNSRHEITIANRMIEVMLGYTSEELLGQPIEIMVPDRFDGHMEARENYYKKPSSRPMGVGMDLYCRRKDGSEMPADISLSPVHTDKGFITMAVIRDITERKAAEEELKKHKLHLEELVKERTTELEELNKRLKSEINERTVVVRALEYQSKFERLIGELSTRFISIKPEEMDKQIARALEEISFFFRADVGYIFQLSESGRKSNVTHLWSAEERNIDEDTLQDLHIKEIPSYAERLKRGEIVVMTWPKDLPEESQSENDLIRSLGIRSIIDVPMSYKDEVFGFIGSLSFEERSTWSEDDVGFFRLIGQILTNALERKHTDEEIHRYTEELESFNKTMVGREGRIIELKEEANRLCKELGREPAYPPVWTESGLEIQNSDSDDSSSGSR